MTANDLKNPAIKPWGNALQYAGVRFLGKTLYRQGAASNDLVDSMAVELAKKAEYKAEWTYEQIGDWEIVVRAIEYMAVIHDGPWTGAEWFDSVLTALIEIAVPNTGLDDQSGAFLSDIQRGVSKSVQSIPIEKAELRLTDEKAKLVKTLEEAACEFGSVSDLLDLCESIFHGGWMSIDQKELLMVAATAAPFARAERIERGIDDLN